MVGYVIGNACLDVLTSWKKDTSEWGCRVLQQYVGNRRLTYQCFYEILCGAIVLMASIWRLLRSIAYPVNL